VLVPGPAALAVLTWVVVLLASRIVSLSSLAAATILVLARLASTTAPFASDNLPVTLYLLIGTGFVVLKHRANVKRLLAGTESRIGDFPMRDTILRGLHLLALGLWFGGAAFFNFGAAPTIFESFKEVVNESPSYRTANETILDKSKSSDENDLKRRRESLASALAGSAVGPVFPIYFAMQAVCAMVAILTARAWAASGGVHRWRVVVLWAALVAVSAGWFVSGWVSQLRVDRFSGNTEVAAAAKEAFRNWHFVSLFLSMVTVCLAGVALALAAKLPDAGSRGAAADVSPG
jgi:glycerol-3-phosphate acyltransferase PlsY